MAYHQPVLLNQVIDALKPSPDKKYIDATLGNAGHTLALLQHGAYVYGIDTDPINLSTATARIQQQGYGHLFEPINDNFANLSNIIKSKIHSPINGVLFDLGLSSNQLKSDNRGFSFSDQTSLDMRLNPNIQELTAEYIINTYNQAQLFDIFSKIAQEKYSRQIASQIIQNRQHHPIKTASNLANIIKNFYTQKGCKTSTHPATKILMALRITVNHEYENILQALTACLQIPQATIAVITFHSGEDRIVKQFIKKHHFSITTQNSKPIKPTHLEIVQNPLSRSSLLRIFNIK